MSEVIPLGAYFSSSSVSATDFAVEDVPPRRGVPAVEKQKFHPTDENLPAGVIEAFELANLDWDVVAKLRRDATGRISEWRASITNPDELDERVFSIRVVGELVDKWVSTQLEAGYVQGSQVQQQLRKATLSSLYGMGRLDPLLECREVENIEIHGHDRVHLTLSDGRIVKGPPVAESVSALVEDLGFWATRSKANARPFTPATPVLELHLDNGSRLAAINWTTRWPVITIRNHNMIDVSLRDLVKRGTITELVANFLAAVVVSGRSVVVAGAQGAGKTTLTRALCDAIPFGERIGVVESDAELQLDLRPDRFPRTFAIETRPGTGEFRPDGREAGVFTLRDGLTALFRHNLDRMIVGEVRGDEAIEMCRAMLSGTGSFSTTHARSARETYDKLVTCCLAAEGVTESYANRIVATTVDFIVFIKKVQVLQPDGSTVLARRVTEIVALELNADGPAFTDVFTADSDGIARADKEPVAHLDSLARAGFNVDAFQREAIRR